MKETAYDIIILGGGISGLVAAYSHQKKGKRVLLLEASDRLGGVIETVTKEGYRLEQGPNSILTNAELQQLIKELGITHKIRKNEKIASTRYLLFKERPLKMKPNWAFLKSGFLNASMVWAFLTERFRKKENLQEESIANFIKRRLSRDILNRMINPLVTGVYAGNPEKLSLRSTFKKLYAMEQEHGSLVKAMFKRDKNAYKREAMSFDGGLKTLIEALGASLGEGVQLNACVYEVTAVKEGFKISFTKNGEKINLAAKKLVSTLPAPVMSELFRFIKPTLAKEIAAIEYAPMMLLYLAYPKTSVGQILDGFGYLNAQQENQPYLGGIWTSTILPEVAKEGNHLFTLFVGGVHNKAILTEPNKAIIKAKMAFENHMKISSKATFQHHYVVKKAIPQFNLGYYKLMEKIDTVEESYHGLQISGNWRTGVAIGDCVAGNL